MERKGVPFDRQHFAKKRSSGRQLGTLETFQEIYDSNHWTANTSVSGLGSQPDQTVEISLQIPKLIKKLNVKTFLDVPCGDFNWFSKISSQPERYIGGDIIPDIVEANSNKYGQQNRTFKQIDLIRDPLPNADLLLCRDCLVHLSNSDILAALNNIKRSNVSYLLTTTFTECDENVDIVTGDWRIINLENAPFNLPTPELLIEEKCTEGEGTYSDKCLGLWKIDQLV